MKTPTFVLCTLLLLVLAGRVESQDVQSKLLKKLKELNIDVGGESSNVPSQKGASGTPGLQLVKVALSDEENGILEAVLKQMKSDPQTTELIKRMKSEEADTLGKMMGSISGPEKIANLRNTLNELKAVEVLFKDPVRALKLMIEDGMVPPDRLPEYKKNPRLLEEDTRKGLYFSLVTMSVSLGIL
jgi:Holliday junction resolvasome RuvABC ATP-dependent DNA helicase subunit